MDEAHEVYEQLWHEIHELVDTRVAHLSNKGDTYVREKLNDEFRFWQRVKEELKNARKAD